MDDYRFLNKVSFLLPCTSVYPQDMMNMKGIGERIKDILPFSKKVKLQIFGAPATVEALASALGPLGKQQNKYEANRAFFRSDPELNNAIMRLALLTSYAYKGPFVRAGKTLTEDERKIQEMAQKEAYELDFRGRFFTISKHLLRDGDDVYVTALDDEAGVQQIQPLPITKLTILEKDDQIGSTHADIQGRSIYVLNEFDENKKQKFPENTNQEILHFSIDNEAEEVLDIAGRWTFGVWSVSPLECLRTELLWKKAIKITDILWRYRNVPREVHELDTTMFVPDKFSGKTWEDQVNAATKAAQDYLKAYAKLIQKKKVDQGYVVGSNVKKIYYVEPTKTAYTSPNEILDQINDSIREGVGAYAIGKGTYATELVIASYVVLMPDHMAYKIKRLLLDVLRKHLRRKYKFKAEDLDKLDIRLSLVLDILKGELIRQAAVLSATGAFTYDEVREHLEKEPLTDEQVARLTDIGKSRGHTQTIFDILATAHRQVEPTEPITPESKRDRQTT